MIKPVLSISPCEVTKAVRAPETCINISYNVRNLYNVIVFSVYLVKKKSGAFILDVNFKSFSGHFYYMKSTDFFVSGFL